MAIERMSWHYNGNYPALLPGEQEGTHTGMFITWAMRSFFFRKNSV